MRTLRLFKTIITYLLLVMMTLSLNSCFIGKAIETGKARREFTEEKNAIPPLFGKKNTVLLCVLQGRNSFDKWLKSAVKKNYKGEYILIHLSDLSSGKYSDKGKYRYVFDYSAGSTAETRDYTFSNSVSNVNTYSPGMIITAKRFNVYDRLEEKKYENGAEFTYFAKAMKVYMANLEIKRASIN